MKKTYEALVSECNALKTRNIELEKRNATLGMMYVDILVASGAIGTRTYANPHSSHSFNVRRMEQIQERAFHG